MTCYQQVYHSDLTAAGYYDIGHSRTCNRHKACATQENQQAGAHEQASGKKINQLKQKLEKNNTHSEIAACWGGQVHAAHS